MMEGGQGAEEEGEEGGGRDIIIIIIIIGRERAAVWERLYILVFRKIYKSAYVRRYEIECKITP